MSRDVFNLPDEVGVSALCSFGEEIYTPAGRVVPEHDAFYLHFPGDRKPERFVHALPAVRKLRKISRKVPPAAAGSC